MSEQEFLIQESLSLQPTEELEHPCPHANACMSCEHLRLDKIVDYL